MAGGEPGDLRVDGRAGVATLCARSELLHWEVREDRRRWRKRFEALSAGVCSTVFHFPKTNQLQHYIHLLDGFYLTPQGSSEPIGASGFGASIYSIAKESARWIRTAKL